MNMPDPRHAAATAPITTPQAPQWGGQPPSVIDPGLIAHLANAFLNATPGQAVDPSALANFAATQERPAAPPTSLPGAIGAAAAVPGTSIPGALAVPFVTNVPVLPLDVARAPAQHLPAAGLATGLTGVPAGAAGPPDAATSIPSGFTNVPVLPLDVARAPAQHLPAAGLATGLTGVPAGAAGPPDAATSIPSASPEASPVKGPRPAQGFMGEPDFSDLAQTLGPVTTLVPRAFSQGLPGAAALPQEALYFLDGAGTAGPPALPAPVPAPPSRGNGPGAAGLPTPPIEQAPKFASFVPTEAELRPQNLDDLSAGPSAPFPSGYSHTTVPTIPGDSFYFLDESRAAVAPVTPASAAVADSRPPEVAPAPLPDLASGIRLFDAHAIKRDFPILHQKVHGKPLIWLDNAATTQKPQAVIDRIARFYENENSNIHRAAHALAARSTDAYEAAREKVRRFLGAGSANDIVFTRGATEAINLVAQAWGRRNVEQGDEIVITWLEHHANIVPWQMLCAETGAFLRVAPVDDSGQVRLDEYARLLSPRTRLVSLPHVSNALGTVTPAREMIAIAHRHGACVLVDGAQAVSHMPVDVQALDCDFYVFSGHKVFAPTGIGVLYGKPDVLAAMPPWQGGGNMIADVTFEKTIYQAPPLRFEAGTGNIADAVGLGAAIDYLERIGMANVSAYEHALLGAATEALQGVPGLTIIGTATEKAGVISFVLDGCRSEDVGAALDREGIAVRAGHHCAQPILRRFGLESTVRPSLALYNTNEDIDALAAALHRIQVQKTHRAR